jgi:hypothetical protein
MYANAFAQFTIPAQNTIGGSAADYFSSMCATRDGGLIAGGTSYSNKSFDKSQNIRSNGDYWVVKMDNHGKIQWDKTIGGIDNDNFSSVIQTSDGGYALIGTSLSNTSVEKSEDSRGSSDYWLVKLDSLGNIQWDKTIGGKGSEYIDNMVQTGDSGYILAGSSNSNISAEKTEDSKGGFDYWIVKLNKNGKEVWDKTIGGSNDDWCSPLALTNDGGVIVGGFSYSNISGDKSENSRGGADYWVVKLDSKGKLQWDKTVGGSVDDYCHGVLQTDDGGYILAGSSLSDISGDKTEYDRGGADYWAVKLDKNRNIQWQKTIGGSSDDWVSNHAVIQTKTGGYMLVGGSFSTASGDKTEYSRGGADYWVVNLSHDGKLLWDKTIGSGSDDWGDAVAEPVKNKFLIGGFSGDTSAFGSGDKKGFSPGFGDYWIVELNYKKSGLTDSIMENADSQPAQKNLTNKTFFIYPNPARNILNIHIDGKAVVSLTDQSGRIMLAKTIDGSGSIDVGKFSSGIYYLNNTATGETQKILISK